MKFFVFAAILATVSAVPALMNTGSSAVSRSDDGCGNYEFGYNEDHATGGTFRKEKGGPGYMTGSYGLRDADGRMRTVTYVADQHGYRASISTNEPGVDVKQDPASANFNLGGHDYLAPVVGAPVAAAYAAPILSKNYEVPLLMKGYEGQLYEDAYAAPVAFPSTYSVATQHVHAPGHYASVPEVFASNGYNNYY